MIAAIDPGKKLMGVACFHDYGLLRSAFLVRSKLGLVDLADEVASAIEDVNTAGEKVTLVLEVPQVYMSDPGKGKSLIDVALSGGAVVHALNPNVIVQYHPHDWKGSVKKEIMTMWIRERWMTEDDHRAVVIPKAKALAHNIYDAVGIGIAHLRKTGVRR